MQKALFKRIVREEIKKQRRNVIASLAVIRKKITLAVAREIMQQSRPPERYWNVFVDATEAEEALWPFLKLEGVRQLVVDMKYIEQLLSLYGRWQRMCEFLIDEYDRLPPRLKGKWTIDDLVEIAAYVATTKEKLFSDFAEREETMLAPGHFLILKGMIDWIRFAALGEDCYLKFLVEMKDLMRILGQHPRFASSRRREEGKFPLR